MDAEIEAEYRLNQACFSKGNKWLIILENGLKRGYFVTNLRPICDHFPIFQKWSQNSIHLSNTQKDISYLKGLPNV